MAPSWFRLRFKRKASRRRFITFVIVAGNVLLIAAVTLLVLQPGHSSANTPPTQTQVDNAAAATQFTALDQLASATIAQTAAQMTGIGEVIPVTNQADSERTLLEQASVSDDVLALKPQVVKTAFVSNKDIQVYVVKRGDTISKIADKFGVSSDSIRWSNAISGNSVQVGKKLYIPPVDGIVHKVAGGETAESLAKKYGITETKVVQYNDAELGGLKVGSLIILAGATKEAPKPTPTYSPSYARFTPVYGYNGYDYGYCTWYVANKINVPIGWGDAHTWDDRARITPGWVVTSTPIPGAVAQHDRGTYGHVAYVEAVSADGSMIKYSDMNGLAGWGRIGYSGWVPASHFPHYIHH